jgi:hypothetical protein
MPATNQAAHVSVAIDRAPMGCQSVLGGGLMQGFGNFSGCHSKESGAALLIQLGSDELTSPSELSQRTRIGDKACVRTGQIYLRYYREGEMDILFAKDSSSGAKDDSGRASGGGFTRQ